MNRLSILTLVATLSAFGCGDSSTPDSSSNPPTAPSGNTTTATNTFTTQIKPSNEVPAVSGSEGNVSGSATITLHTTKNASGAVTGATADFQVSVSGFPAGSAVTMAHIHPGTNSQNMGIIVNTGITSSDITLSGGAGSFTRTGINVSADVAQGILNNPGAYYFNIHSLANPNGVARGQMDGSGAPAGPNPNPNPTDPTDPYNAPTSLQHHH